LKLLQLIEVLTDLKQFFYIK